MILCVCLNCAVDITYHVDLLRPGSSHRVHDVQSRAGGKAVNVARVLQQLGRPAHVMGFIGGTSGTTILDDLARCGIGATPVTTTFESRRTVTVVAPEGATVFNEPGGPIAATEWQALCRAFETTCVEADSVVLSGSLPTGVPDTAYAELTRLAHGHGVPVLLDADGSALRAGIEAAPEVVKPNDAETAALLGRPIPTAGDTVDAARALLDLGARQALISRGAEGLVALRENRALQLRLRKPLSGNPTGAGDALAAVIAAGMLEPNWADTLRRAVAVSASAVCRPVAGEYDPEVADRLLPDIELTELPCPS